MDPAIQTRHLATGERILRHLAAGWPGQAGGSGTVVFLHAFPLNAEMWRGQLRALPQGWAGVAPDFRGFGHASPDLPAAPPRADAQLDDYVDDVIAVMDAAGVRRAVFCGCSMGGYALFALLRRAAERVAGLVLVDTRATADTERDRASRTAMLDLLAAQGPGVIAEQMLPRLLGESTRASGAAVSDEVRRLAAAATVSGVGHAIVRMMNRPDATPLVGAIACPTLVIAGEEDVLIPPAEAEALQRGIPGSQLVMIPRAGHLPNLERTDAFNAVLSSWLSEVERRDRPNPESPIPNPDPSRSA